MEAAVTAPKPLTEWQSENTPLVLPRHIRRNIGPGDNGCWVWLRSRDRDGYGWASLDNKTYSAHRLVFVLLGGVIPDGLVLDHLCRVRHCVNPAHLEPVTNRENLARGDTPTGWKRCRKCGGPFSRLRSQRRCMGCFRNYTARQERKTHV